MCWLLIRKRSNPRLRSWKAGDIVEVRSDDCAWGRLERGPDSPFYCMQIVGLDAAKVKARLEETETHEEFRSRDGTIQSVLVRVRRHQVRRADMPAAVLAALQRDGQISVTRAQAANFIRDNAGTLARLD